MTKCEMDIAKSKEVYLAHRKIVMLNECYKNIYCIAEEYYDLLRTGEWKIAFGYVETGVDCILARHCFLINAQGKVIDPTIYLAVETCRKKHRIDRSYPSYYVMHTFQDYIQYLHAILKEERYALEGFFKTKDREAQVWARDHGLALIG